MGCPIDYSYRRNFECYTVQNVINTPPPPTPRKKKMPKSCFQRKEMPMTKRRKVLNFHSWLHRAMEGLFLGCLSLFLSVTPLSKL